MPSAAGSFDKAIAAKPEWAEAHFALANAYAAQKKLDSAIASYRETVRLSPENGEAFFRLAVTLYGAEQYAESWEAVHKAQALNFNVNPAFLDALKQQMPEPEG